AATACTGPIRFAITTPTTSALALLGLQARNGEQFAVDELNEAGGIAGQRVELVVEDTAASTATALSAVNRVLEGNPLVLFGSNISPQVFTQTEAVKKAGVPFIVSATNAEITNQATPWLFRIHAHDGQLADLVPRHLVQTMGAKKPGIIAVADDYGLGASRGMQATLTALGAPAVSATSYAPTDRDMSAQLLEIQARGADSFIVFGRPGDVALVLKQAKSLGIDMPRIGNASMVAQTTLNNLTAAEADGAVAVGGMIPQTSTDPKIKAWAAAVERKFKVPADNFTVAYYDAVQLLRDIIPRVGCDRAAIRDALAATKDWPGMLIRYTADGRGDLAHTLGIYRNKGKTPELTGPIQERGF
ncbi:MAG: ABC transporter substrate-binding protein, partial [Gemmatimonadaceae bacterium]|nr:ABC transporter substrate-binding protein [Acetobacteraceae bacterium]